MESDRMTPLHSKIMRRAEFDAEKFNEVYQTESKDDPYHDGIEEGARWQSEQNKPLIEALAKVCELATIEFKADLLGRGVSSEMIEALSSLAGIVGEK